MDETRRVSPTPPALSGRGKRETAMPRYFFHFASHTEFIPDYDGVILDDLKAAHRHAMRLIWQTIPIMQGEDLRHWHVEVADESQFVVLRGGVDRALRCPATRPQGGAPRW